MSALIELYAPGDNEFVDGSVHVWYDTATHSFSTAQGVLRVSDEGYALDRYWPPYIVGMSNIQYRIGRETGGHASLSFGNVEFSPELFTELWPPESAFAFVLYFYDGTTSHRITSGMLHLSGMKDTGISYEVYETKYEVNFLDEMILYRDDGVYTDAVVQPVPLALGAVEHQQPARLADIVGGTYDGHQQYYKAGLAGVVVTNWHVFDDGVDIDSNVSFEDADVFYLSAAPVGEVTISGTGTIETLADAVDYARQKMGLSIDITDARAVSPALSHYWRNQTTALNAASELCAAHTHLFWIDTSTLYLIDMFGFSEVTYIVTNFSASMLATQPFGVLPLGSSGNLEQMVSNSDQLIDSRYETNPAVASFMAEWVERFSVTITAGNMIREKTESHTVFTQRFYGADESVEIYQASPDAAEITLGNMSEIYLRKQAEITLPLSHRLYTPGEKFVIEDDTMHLPLYVDLHVRGANYDLAERKITLTGDCEMS